MNNQSQEKLLKKQQIRKEYLQELSNNNYVFDFHKIYKKGFPYNLLMTERGAGKDFNAKEFALDVYNIHGHKSVWVYNTQEFWDREILKFINANRIINRIKWQGVEVTKQGLIKDGKIFMEFVALSSGLKGSRDMGYKHLFYNEINEKMKTIGNKQTSLLSTLINTFKDSQSNDGIPLTVWLFGNSKSLFLPLFVDLKIFAITDEITDIVTETGKPFLKIIAIKPDIEDVEKRYKDDPHYYFDKITGEHQHNYLNEFFDDINGIEKEPDNKEHIQSYKVDGRYYAAWQIDYIDNKGNKKYRHYISKINEPIGDVITWNKKDLEYGVEYNQKLKLVIIEMLMEQSLTFDNVSTKITFLNSL